jgi:hypothetical protein
MPRAWSIEELRRFEEIKEGLRSQQRHAPARARPASPARPRRAPGPANPGRREQRHD